MVKTVSKSLAWFRRRRLRKEQTEAEGFILYYYKLNPNTNSVWLKLVSEVRCLIVAFLYYQLQKTGLSHFQPTAKKGEFNTYNRIIIFTKK